MLDKNRMASGREEAFKACAVSLVAAKRAVFCWQCFSNLGLALIVLSAYVSAGSLVAPHGPFCKAYNRCFTSPFFLNYVERYVFFLSRSCAMRCPS